MNNVSLLPNQKLVTLRERVRVCDQVVPSSPAEQAGIRPGDVIISVQGKAIKTTEDFFAQLDLYAGGALSLRVIRTTIDASGRQTDTELTFQVHPIDVTR